MIVVPTRNIHGKLGWFLSEIMPKYAADLRMSPEEQVRLEAQLKADLRQGKLRIDRIPFMAGLGRFTCPVCVTRRKQRYGVTAVALRALYIPDEERHLVHPRRLFRGVTDIYLSEADFVTFSGRPGWDAIAEEYDFYKHPRAYCPVTGLLLWRKDNPNPRKRR